MSDTDPSAVAGIASAGLVLPAGRAGSLSSAPLRRVKLREFFRIPRHRNERDGMECTS